jgi:hypothetical protein
MPKEKKNIKQNITRSIRVYSNATDTRLDYNKEYVFHHWISKRKALIEVVENGYLMEVKYDGNFDFNVINNKK